MYDQNNIFAKIIEKKIPCDLIYEDDNVIFFKDINPIAKIHILCVPKDKVENFSEFILKCGEDKVSYFFKKIIDIVKLNNLNKTGYRLITNEGKDSNQEVQHFHVHLLGGEKL